MNVVYSFISLFLLFFHRHNPAGLCFYRREYRLLFLIQWKKGVLDKNFHKSIFIFWYLKRFRRFRWLEAKIERLVDSLWTKLLIFRSLKQKISLSQNCKTRENGTCLKRKNAFLTELIYYLMSSGVVVIKLEDREYKP